MGVVASSALRRRTGWDGEGVARVAEDGAVESEARIEGISSGLGGEWKAEELREPRETSGRVPAESFGPGSSGSDMGIDLHRSEVFIYGQKSSHVPESCAKLRDVARSAGLTSKTLFLTPESGVILGSNS
jgi:hypothetical protein